MASSLDLSSILLSSLKAVSIVLLKCGFGFGLAAAGVMTQSRSKTLSDIISVICMPCLYLVNISAAISVSTAIYWWPIPMFSTFAMGLGVILAFPLMKVVRCPQHFKGLYLCSVAMPNITSIPLSILESLCKDGPFAKIDNSLIMTSAYCNLFGAFMSVYMWVFLYNYFLQILDYVTNATVPSEPADEEMVPLEDPTDDSASKQPNNNSGKSEGEEDIQPYTYKQRAIHKYNELYSRLPKVVQRTLSPLTISCVVAVVIGLIPPVKSLFFGKHPPLGMVTSILDSIGAPAVSLLLLVLGATMYHESSIKMDITNIKLISSIGAARLIVIPAIGTSVMYFLKQVGAFHGTDHLMLFVILLQFSAPTNINMIMIAQKHNIGKMEMSTVMLWTYMISIITLTAQIVLYLYLFW